MKRTLLLFLASLFCIGIAAQGTEDSEGTLEITRNVSIAPGTPSNGKVYFTINVKAPDADKRYTAYQMDIKLPSGVQFDVAGGKPCKINKGNSSVYPFTYDDDDNKEFTHTLSCGEIQDNTVTVLTYSNESEAFRLTDGALFNVYVQATPYAKPGDFQVNITGIKFVSPDETKYLYEDQTLTAGTIANSSTVPLKIAEVNKISTAIFPFSCALPDGLEVYAATGVDGDYITLAKQESIAAFTPYILYAENGIDETLNGTIDANNYPAETVVTDGWLTGVLSNTEVAAGYVLQNKGDGPKFYKIGATPFTIPAGKCYANPRAANISSLSFLFDDDDPDCIQGVASPTSGTTVIYDLQGKKVTRPESGQIYVINGQKVLKR